MTEKPIIAPRTPAGDQFQAGLRQVLLMLGGFAVSRGFVSHGELEIIVGALVILISLVWGQWKVRRRAKQVSTLSAFVPDYVAHTKRRRHV